MSVTSSFPCIKIPTCSSCTSSSSSTSSHSLRFSSSSSSSPSSKPYHHHAVLTTIRNSQTEGPIRRPVAPPVRDPSSGVGGVPQPLKPTPPSSQPQQPPQPPQNTVAPPLPKPAVSVGDDQSVVTFEFQRQKAKELQEYLKQKKIEEANQGPFFGFIGKNEISNGRAS